MAFKSFNPEDRAENIVNKVAERMWSDNTATLTTFYTGSTQNSNTGKYYLDVHKSSDESTDVQFAISYGHYAGSGSEGSTTSGTTNPTKAIYSQLKQVLLPPQTTKFNFHGNSGANYYSDDVFAIVSNRARYREKMDPGNWELHLVSGSTTVKLIDDSGASRDQRLKAANREFNIVSGSIANDDYRINTTASASAAATNSGSYGLFYPESGIILLNPNALSNTRMNIGRASGSYVIPQLVKSTSTNNYEHRKLLESIQSGSYFSARREEVRRSSFYFCRVENSEFNHSQNPSFFTGSNAQLLHNSFIAEPTTYITSVGLYNNQNELLAVAKMSKPFKKDPNTEALIKVRLDY